MFQNRGQEAETTAGAHTRRLIIICTSQTSFKESLEKPKDNKEAQKKNTRGNCSFWQSQRNRKHNLTSSQIT
jgi:hypothetical protein